MSKKIRCKRCGSAQTYTRLSTEERVCKQCGYVEKIKLKGGKTDDVWKEKARGV